MKMVCKLDPNSEVVLIDRGNKYIGVYEKSNVIDVTNPIIDLVDSEYTVLEEIPMEEKGKVKFVERYCICSGSYKSYILKLIDIDLSRLIKHNEIKFVSVSVPEKVSDNFYMYEDVKDGLCLVDIMGRVTNLEKGIRYSLGDRKINIENVILYCFDCKKNPNIYELTIDFDKTDTLHIFLNIDKDIEFYNTFYSEMADGKPLVFCDTCSKDEFINLSSFSMGLAQHSIINNIEYVSNYEKDCMISRKNKIRKKVWNKLIGKNNN